MNTKLLATVASAVVFSAGAAFAGHHEGGEKDWEAKVEEKVAAMDADGNGSVSESEYLAYKAGKASKEWTKMAEGAGDDGEVSADEAKAMYAAK
ncbi:MAG: hypothetical protein AAGB02_09710, partial [Pseudomonadota bacterium]